MARLSQNWHSGKAREQDEAKNRAAEKEVTRYCDVGLRAEVTVYAGPSDVWCSAKPVGFGREWE